MKTLAQEIGALVAGMTNRNSRVLSRVSCDRCDPPDFHFLPLSKGLFALVNNTDLREVLKHKWQVKLRPRGPAYAVTTVRGEDGRRHMVQLHRLVWQLHGGHDTPVVDHEDGVGLDCRWHKLRAAGHDHNAWNASAHRDSKSGVRGVDYDRRAKKWRARVTRGGKRVTVYCEDEACAIAARDRMVREMHGEFAR